MSSPARTTAATRVIAYNSCRNRHCPKCQGAAAREWLAEREAELLPVPYFHVVFTLPARIAAIAFQNKAVVYDLLFKAASETMLTIAADPKHLGARIGITAVLHTLGLGHDASSACAHDRAGRRDSADGTALDHRSGGLPAACPVLSRLFRRMMLERLAAAYGKGLLILQGGLARLAPAAAFAAALKPLRRKNWFVYAKRPFAGPKAVLAYLSRYTHRVGWTYKGKFLQKKTSSRFEFPLFQPRKRKPVLLEPHYIKPNRDGTGEPILYVAGLHKLSASKKNGRAAKIEGKRPPEVLPEVFYFDRCE